jgi:TRAP-type C4-dicarboxylate transport system substrate-binding protein
MVGNRLADADAVSGSQFSHPENPTVCQGCRNCDQWQSEGRGSSSRVADQARRNQNAVRSAQVEAGEFILSGLANESPIFALASVPFVATSYPAALKLYNASKAYLTAERERQNIVSLFSVPWPGQGLYTDRAIDGVEDLQGLKMRAYSPQTERLAQAVGAVPTQV